MDDGAIIPSMLQTPIHGKNHQKAFFNYERNPQAVKELEIHHFFCSLMFSMEFNPWKNYSTGGWIPHSINLMAINCGYTLRWFEIFTKLSKCYLELFLKRRAVLIFQRMHWIPMSQWMMIRDVCSSHLDLSNNSSFYCNFVLASLEYIAQQPTHCSIHFSHD